MGQAKNVLELQGVASRTESNLREISMRLSKGDFVSILCPESKNIAMEIFKLFSFLDKPKKGKVLLDGEDITQLKEKEIERRRLSKIGLVLPKMIPTLTVIDNLTLLMREAGIPKMDADERAKALIDSAGLTNKSNMLPSALSALELHKLAIARSLANSPKILIANEPTFTLKPEVEDEVINDLRKTSKEGKAVILITTKPEIAKKADKQMKLQNGTIVPM
ncbi:MAG: ATP-binding cassette domain-containing protein [Thermoplasmata archaeon]